MCGIAGILDLAGERTAPEGAIEAMAQALIHRGPDEEGYFRRNGVQLASRRLSIVGLADGQQPISNEDRSVSVVFNGELFDYVEQRAELQALGITAAGVRTLRCAGESSAYRYRYSGLVLLLNSNGQYVFLPTGVPSAEWLNLFDGMTISMLRQPTGARWHIVLGPGDVRLYAIGKIEG